MYNSNDWSNYANHNQRLAWGDTSEADRGFHERERQRAEERAREEARWEQKRREDEERRNRRY